MIDLSGFGEMNIEAILEALPDNFVKSAQQLQVRVFLLYTQRALRAIEKGGG